MVGPQEAEPVASGEDGESRHFGDPLQIRGKLTGGFFMRRAILLIAIAMAASLAAAQDQSNTLVPDSSIEKPGDIGLRMHTNYYMRVPDPQVTPNSPPPGTTIETPRIDRLHL
jgi:hypothetical protein